MVCRRYTRAFLHPLAAKGLPFAANLVTYHNISYMMVSWSATGWPQAIMGVAGGLDCVVAARLRWIVGRRVLPR